MGILKNLHRKVDPGDFVNVYSDEGHCYPCEVLSVTLVAREGNVQAYRVKCRLRVTSEDLPKYLYVGLRVED